MKIGFIINFVPFYSKMEEVLGTDMGKFVLSFVYLCMFFIF